MQKTWRKFVNDKNGKPAMAQRPNVPIILWAVLALLTRLVHVAPWHGIVSVGSTLALTVWAALEIGLGASYFRRTLGALVLVFSVVSRFM